MELRVRVLAGLAAGLGMRATARGFEVEPHTVLGWLVEAAEQLRAFSRSCLCALHINQVQLDALYAVLRAGKDGALKADEASQCLERAPHWVWTAREPASQVLLAIDMGPRTLAMAQRFVPHVAQVLAPDGAPLFVPDGFREYMTAWLTHSGHWVQPAHRLAKGPWPSPTGCRGPSCSMRRWSKPCAAGAWLPSSTAWSSARSRPPITC